MRILLAEDEKSLNRIITKQLKAAGYSVDSCFDGGEAYDLITSTDYDAAVFDVMMPIMNGFELVKKISCVAVLLSLACFIVSFTLFYYLENFLINCHGYFSLYYKFN